MLPLAVTKRTWPASLLFFLAIAGGTESVSAAEPGAPAAARLEVNARIGCTSREELIARARARSPRVRFTDNGEAIEIRADFAATSAGLIAGTVSLSWADAKPSVRRVLGASCNDAADAVALIIAVTLDPTAADRVKAAPTSAASSADSRNGGTAASPNSAKSAATVQAVSQPSTDALASQRRSTLALQLAAQALLGPSPKVMPGVALFVTVSLEPSRLWAPAVVLGASHAWRTNIDEQGGTAAFSLDSASIDACPLRFRWGPVVARPCGSALVGRLSARGSQTRNPATESGRPFWVLGGAVVATAKLTDLVELTFRLAVGANLVRDSFSFTPVVFHEVAVLTEAASLGIGMRFR